MSYLDYEKLETIDPAQFQQAKPYPKSAKLGMGVSPYKISAAWLAQSPQVRRGR